MSTPEQFTERCGCLYEVDFTMECQECGRTVNWVNGERVPSACAHAFTPAVVIECTGPEASGE